MKRLALCSLLCLATAVAMPGSAQTVPFMINYQGKLLDLNGDPLPTADYDLSFSIYDNAQSGVPIWGPQVFDGIVASVGHGPRIPVVQGHFNIILGPVDTGGRSIAPAFTSGSSRFLEITVGSNDPIRPRQQILTAPFALQAENANHAAEADHAAEANHAQNADHALNADNATRLAGYDWERVFQTPGSANSKVKDSILPNDLVRDADLDHLDASGGSPQRALVVDGAGKVGIGTATPQATLHVMGANASVRVGANASNGDSKFLYFGDNSLALAARNDFLMVQAPHFEVQYPAGFATVQVPGAAAQMQISSRFPTAGTTLRLGANANDGNFKGLRFGDDETYIAETDVNTVSIATGSQGKLEVQADSIEVNGAKPIALRQITLQRIQQVFSTGISADEYTVAVVGAWPSSGSPADVYTSAGVSSGSWNIAFGPYSNTGTIRLSYLVIHNSIADHNF